MGTVVCPRGAAEGPVEKHSNTSPAGAAVTAPSGASGNVPQLEGLASGPSGGGSLGCHGEVPSWLTP